LDIAASWLRISATASRTDFRKRSISTSISRATMVRREMRYSSRSKTRASPIA